MDKDSGLILGGIKSDSRLIVGTGGLSNLDVLESVLKESETYFTTVAIRKIDEDTKSSGLLSMLKGINLYPIPNTAGSLTSVDAVYLAKMGCDLLETNMLKLEVVSDPKDLLPHGNYLVDAAYQLVSDGYKVLAYTNDDPVLAVELAKIGCTAVMPGGSPIGSGNGILNPYNISSIVEKLASLSVPVILDAGIGTASDATLAMELGCDGVLVATSVTRANNPVAMAKAMSLAVESGRLAYNSGRIPKSAKAFASSPEL